jgi:hypothetical protein
MIAPILSLSEQHWSTTPRGGFLEIAPVLRTLSKRKRPEDTLWVSWGHIGPQALLKTLWKRLWDHCVLRTALQSCPWDTLIGEVSWGQLTQCPEDTFVGKCLQDAHWISIPRVRPACGFQEGGCWNFDVPEVQAHRSKTNCNRPIWTSEAKPHTSDPPGSTSHSTMSNPPQSHSQYPQNTKIDPLLHLVKTHNQQQQNPPKKIKKRKKLR